MSKLLDRLHIHHDAPERQTEAPAKVPESPEVREHGLRATTPPQAARGVRWLRWIPVFVLLVAGIVAVTFVVTDNGTDVGQDATVPGGASSYELVQESIDQALAANQPTAVSSYQLVQESIDQALAANQPTVVSSYQLVQDAIDQALAANQPATEYTNWLTPTTGPGSTQLGPTVPVTVTTVSSDDLVEANRIELIKDLALDRAVNDGSYDRAEANRVELIKDLALDRAVDDGSFDRAEANRMEVLQDL